MGDMIKTSRPFQVFLKPAGSACNLRCSYCYYLETLAGLPRYGLMPDEILEKYIIDHFDAAAGPDYFFSWHGGEPTLAGIDFYRRAVSFQKKHQPAGSVTTNGIQTNATLISDEWCRFFSAENFYVGVSIDGPGDLHNRARTSASGEGSFSKTIAGYEMLRKYGIRNEILCVVSSINSSYPLEVYRFLKGLGAEYMTFLPLVIRNETVSHGAENISVEPEAFGDFLCTIFDEWLADDIGRIRIQIIEESIGTVFSNDHTLCIFKKICGGVPVVERNGDFYSCDHFVDSRYLVGNINSSTLSELLDSEAQRDFGEAKFKTLPKYCLKCEVLDMCNGECPKNRFVFAPGGEPGLNYLCRGYRKFFNHIRSFTEAVAAEWKSNKS
jgi:uncharacterized protein